MQRLSIPDRKACIRMLSRLRCGVAPHEGLRYLSVGLDREIALIEQYLEKVTEGQSALLVVERAYGEGKSHMLQLIGELAQDWSCATVYLAHNHLNEASLHRPSILFRHILQGLQWYHPNLDLKRYYWEMNASYSYSRDREMRDRLADALSGLAQHLRFTHEGLVIMLDEVENTLLLHHRSKPIALQVLTSLCRNAHSAHGCCLVLATTPQWAQLLGQALNAQPLSPPTLTEETALALFNRLVALHAEALNWTPTLDSKLDARQVYRRIVAAAPASLWRAFVQRVVNLLEIEHQRTREAAAYTVPIVSRPVAVPPKREITPAMLPPPPLDLKSTIAVGDTVTITGGPMRGCVCKVTEIHGDKVRLAFGRNAIPVQISIHQVKKQRR